MGGLATLAPDKEGQTFMIPLWHFNSLNLVMKTIIWKSATYLRPQLCFRLNCWLTWLKFRLSKSFDCVWFVC